MLKGKVTLYGYKGVNTPSSVSGDFALKRHDDRFMRCHAWKTVIWMTFTHS